MSAPNQTLYVHNLNDGVRGEELKAQLFYLFGTYGKVVDIVAQKGPTKRGQAFIVFRDLAAATSAMRSLDGELFYDKKMRIEYAKSKSHATLRAADPNFVPPKLNQSTMAAHGGASSSKQAKTTVSNAENDLRKRARESEGEGAGGKKRRGGEDEEMDMDEEEEDEESRKRAAATANSRIPVSSILYCENLPAEVTEDVLGVLFQQYSGFQGTKLSPLDPATRSKTAHVRYDSPEQASDALKALNGFQLKKGWAMRVAYAAL